MTKFLFTIFVFLMLSGCVSTAVDQIPSKQFGVINVTVHRPQKNMGLWPHMFRSDPELQMAGYEIKIPHNESEEEVYERSLNTAAPIAKTTYSGRTTGEAGASGAGGALGGAIVASIVNSHNRNLEQISQSLRETIQVTKFPEEWEGKILSNHSSEKEVNVSYTDAPAQDPELSKEDLNLSMLWSIDTLTSSRNFISTTGASVVYKFVVYGKFVDSAGKVRPVLQAIDLIVADVQSSSVEESIARWSANNGELVRVNLNLAVGVVDIILRTTIENLSSQYPRKITAELLGLPDASVSQRFGSHYVLIRR